MTSKVYYADLRAEGKEENLLCKLEKLTARISFLKELKKEELVAVKLHFGEPGGTAFIRPLYLQPLVQQIKQEGARPFLTDANTLYRGQRSNAVDHIETALRHGFSYPMVEAPVVIADGLTGRDYYEEEVDFKHFKGVKIPAAIYHCQAMLVVTHLTGHPLTGFGGALKNVGMGLGPRSSKQMQHAELEPEVDDQECILCGECIKWCPEEAISMPEGEERVFISQEDCIGCGECVTTCPQGAINDTSSSSKSLQEKIVESTAGILQRIENTGYITFVMDVTPYCDCPPWSDASIVPSLGILASDDPVACDQAAVDLINSSQPLKESMLEGKDPEQDIFRSLFPEIDWEIQLDYAQQLGLGSRDYRLLDLDGQELS